jgi:galactokinase
LSLASIRHHARYDFGEQRSIELVNRQTKRVLSLFNQLPEAEQERMIDTFELRLKEIDEYVEKYLRGRYNHLTQSKISIA